LTQGLVHPAVLAMEEMPHDKVSARMHERNLPARPQVAAPLLPHDSNELTTFDDDLGKPLTIESQKQIRIGDDDPTVLQVRAEDRRGKLDTPSRGTGLDRGDRPERGERPSGKARTLDAERAAKARAIELDRTKPDGLATLGSGGHGRVVPVAPTDSEEALVDTSLIGRTSADRQLTRLPLILVLVIVAIVAAAIGLFLGGVIRV
jgi:hypothetical protein